MCSLMKFVCEMTNDKCKNDSHLLGKQKMFDQKKNYFFAMGTSSYNSAFEFITLLLKDFYLFEDFKINKKYIIFIIYLLVFRVEFAYFKQEY